MVIVVFNDAAYSAEVHHFKPTGEPVDLVQFPDMDSAAIGRALGLRGRRRIELTSSPSGNGPQIPRDRAVLDSKLVPTVVASWLADASGTLISIRAQ